jgi:tetratricopeptide (TPR) repeat protein
MSRMRMKEALEQVFMARDLDPFSLIVNTNVGWVLDRAGRHEDAIVQFEKTLALDSTYTQARWRLADALMNAGHVSEAITQGERLVSLSDSAPPALAMLAETEARGGQRDLALRLLGRARARAGANYLPPASVAGVFARLGEVDSALTWLEKTIAERSNASVYLGGEQKDSPLRRDPRFRALLVRVGLE